MTTVERATLAFIAALEEARTLDDREQPAELADLLRHARELLDIVDEELAMIDDRAIAEATMVAKAMRDRLAAVEGALIVRH